MVFKDDNAEFYIFTSFTYSGVRGGGGGKARFNVADLTRPLHVQHTYYCIIYKQKPFNIISRGVQRWTSTDFRLK